MIIIVPFLVIILIIFLIDKIYFDQESIKQPKDDKIKEKRIIEKQKDYVQRYLKK